MSEAWVGIIVSVFIGLATIGVAVLIGWWQIRKSSPKRQLTYELDVTPLISHASVTAAEKVQVSVSGQQLSNPHVVRLKVRSTSRVDIPSDIFDGQNSLYFDLETPIYEILDGDVSQISLTRGNTGLYLEPQLIKPGEKAFVTVITEGPPHVVSVSKTLIDTTVIRADSSDVFPLNAVGHGVTGTVLATAVFTAPLASALAAKLDIFSILAVILVPLWIVLYLIGFLFRRKLRGHQIGLRAVLLEPIMEQRSVR